jgi:DNA-directed RNA polymerase subunit RPC12/RpoP
LPQMQPLKPCARCEQELPESFFSGRDAAFCRHCSHEVTTLLNKKYSVIEAALFRAQLRHSSKQLQQKMGSGRKSRPIAAAGD